jgi:RNA recognition motif-containing protein
MGRTPKRRPVPVHNVPVAPQPAINYTPPSEDRREYTVYIGNIPQVQVDTGLEDEIEDIFDQQETCFRCCWKERHHTSR